MIEGRIGDSVSGQKFALVSTMKAVRDRIPVRYSYSPTPGYNPHFKTLLPNPFSKAVRSMLIRVSLLRSSYDHRMRVKQCRA